MVYQQTFQIRRFEPKDTPSVIEINRLCLPENYTPSFYLDIYRNCAEAFLVAEIMGRIIGYCMCRIEFGFSNFNKIKMVKKGHLVSIAVLEPFRRRDVGNSLLAKTLYALGKKGAKECFLEVRHTNTAGIALYKKHGFQFIRLITHYYQDRTDALLMSKRLMP